MFNSVYEKTKAFQKKFPGGIAWRVQQHATVVEKHLNPNEQLLFSFAGQYNEGRWEMFDTAIVALTSERIIIGHKNILPGYKFVTVTPDMYNDLTVICGIIWGKVQIDTVKERITISNLSKKALPEIETFITMFMEEAKKQYPDRDKK